MNRQRNSWYANAQHRAPEDWQKLHIDHEIMLALGDIPDGMGKHRADS